LVLPSWTKSLSREAQDKIKARAKESFQSALDGEREYERKLKIAKRVFSSAQAIQEGTTLSASLTECRYRY
jgi:hypothetical protein